MIVFPSESYITKYVNENIQFPYYKKYGFVSLVAQAFADQEVELNNIQIKIYKTIKPLGVALGHREIRIRMAVHN